MKNLFSNLGFKKQDELERTIVLKSLMAAYLFTIVFLFLDTIYHIITKDGFSQTFFLLIIQNILLLGFQSYYKHKLNKDLEDENKSFTIDNSLKPLTLVLIFLLAIILFAFCTLLVY